MGWLHAAPKPDPRSQAAKAKREPVTRLAAIEAAGQRPDYPPVSAGHILGYLFEIGLSEAGGMAPAPLSWGAIEAWQRVSGVMLDGWEARLIRRLSVEYLAERHAAESENRIAPWRPAATEASRQMEIDRLRMVLG